MAEIVQEVRQAPTWAKVLGGGILAGGVAYGGYRGYRYYQAHHSGTLLPTNQTVAANTSATTTGSASSATTTGSAGPGPNSSASSSTSASTSATTSANAGGQSSTGASSTGFGGSTSTGGTTTGSTSSGSSGFSSGSGTTTSGTTSATASMGSLPDWQSLEDGPFSNGNVLRGNYVTTSSGSGPIPETLVQEAAAFEQQRQAAVIAAAKAAFTGNKSVAATDNPYIVPSVPSGSVATWVPGYGWNIVQAGNTWLAQVPAMIRQMGTGGSGSTPTGTTYLEDQELSAQYKAAANFAPETVYLIPGRETPGGQAEYMVAPSNQPLTSIDVHFTSPQSLYTAQPNAADGGPGPTILGGGNPGGPWEVLSTAYGTPSGSQTSIPSGYTGLLLSIPTGIQVFARNGVFVGRTS